MSLPADSVVKRHEENVGMGRTRADISGSKSNVRHRAVCVRDFNALFYEQYAEL